MRALQVGCAIVRRQAIGNATDHPNRVHVSTTCQLEIAIPECELGKPITQTPGNIIESARLSTLKSSPEELNLRPVFKIEPAEDLGDREDAAKVDYSKAGSLSSFRERSNRQYSLTLFRGFYSESLQFDLHP